MHFFVAFGTSEFAFAFTPSLLCHDRLPPFDFAMQNSFLLHNAVLELAAVHVAELEYREEMRSFVNT